jgi:hypothetical protein
MILFVPALQVDVIVIASDLTQAEHLGVVSGAQLEIRCADFDVAQTEDWHEGILDAFASRWKAVVPVCGTGLFRDLCVA